MISAFGTRALRYARELGAAELDAVIADWDAIGNAYLEAVARRGRNEPFYTMVLWDDPRLAYGYTHANQILGQFGDFDIQRIVLDQFRTGELPVNGVPVAKLWTSDALVEGIATEFLALGDAMLVRSYGEIPAMESWFVNSLPARMMPPIERVLPRVQVPVVERRAPERPGVVVWAPHRPALQMALHAQGLREFQGDLTFVTGGGAVPGRAAGTFLRPGDPAVADALATAAAIVCIEPNDPGDAVAFARLGYGVVAPVTCGAHEFASDVVTWDALNPRFLFTAVAVALTRACCVRIEPPVVPRAPQAPARPAFIDPGALPLVSIITPTYNRREQLAEMLSCLAAQTYANIEAVVVNDGGEDVADVVAAFPFARLIVQSPNAGALRAVELGRAEARGEYIGLLPDDDWLYPDHVERLVYAMLRSGAAIAHGSALLRFLERDGNGRWRTRGLNNRTFSQTLTPSDALVTATLGGHQMLVHRSAYESAGGYLLDSDVADNEIHIRFSKRYFYAFADHVTAEFRDHADGQGRQCDFPAALRHMYDVLHPIPERPILMRTRESTILNIAERPAGQPPFPITLVVTTVTTASGA